MSQKGLDACHDANNTMTSELKAVADFREKVQSRCTCLDFKDCR